MYLQQDLEISSLLWTPALSEQCHSSHNYHGVIYSFLLSLPMVQLLIHHHPELFPLQSKSLGISPQIVPKFLTLSFWQNSLLQFLLVGGWMSAWSWESAVVLRETLPCSDLEENKARKSSESILISTHDKPWYQQCTASSGSPHNDQASSWYLLYSPYSPCDVTRAGSEIIHLRLYSD